MPLITTCTTFHYYKLTNFTFKSPIYTKLKLHCNYLTGICLILTTSKQHISLHNIFGYLLKESNKTATLSSHSVSSALSHNSHYNVLKGHIPIAIIHCPDS
jgi:hypothetical protein